MNDENPYSAGNPPESNRVTSSKIFWSGIVTLCGAAALAGYAIYSMYFTFVELATATPGTIPRKPSVIAQQFSSSALIGAFAGVVFLVGIVLTIMSHRTAGRK